MRLIDADALSDYLYTFYECADYITVGQILNDIDEQPTIEPEQRWTPVTERLPEEYGEYLVIYKSDEGQIFMDIIEYETSYEFDHEKNRFKGNWLFADGWQAVNSEVIAWMPLPERYQEGGDSE